ncbi:MAG: sigma-70 family RNA polymerase sigma factor [Planctomycetota bacterium]
MDEREPAVQLERLAAGDVDALQRLIVYYHGPLRNVVAGRIGSEPRQHLDPDDILQQAYVAAFRAVGDCHFDGPSGFYKWLERIALNQLKDARRALRRQKRDVARQAPAELDFGTSCPDLIHRLAAGDTTPSRAFARDEAVAAVLSSLARLNEDQRAVVRLRFLENRSVADVAVQLGKSEPAIHMLCHRGLKTLRQLMISLTHYLTRL